MNSSVISSPTPRNDKLGWYNQKYNLLLNNSKAKMLIEGVTDHVIWNIEKLFYKHDETLNFGIV